MPKISKKRSQKGSIALFVLLSLLFFLIVVTSVSVSTKNRESGVNNNFSRIKQIYEKDIGKEAQVFQEKQAAIEQEQNTINIELEVDPNGGTWRGTSQKTEIAKQGENNIYIENPVSPEVTYDGNGGRLEKEKDVASFNGWKLTGKGSLVESNIYKYGNGKGILTATYQQIILSSVTRTGYTCTGWYDENENEVGDIGDIYTPTSVSVRLTAHWVATN